jgi:serine protease Do
MKAKKIILTFVAFCAGGIMLGMGLGAGYAITQYMLPEPKISIEQLDSPDTTITTVRINPLVVPINPNEPCFVEIIPDAKASVVSINVTATTGRNTREIPASGSGFIFAEDDEYIFIATNNHVIENTSSISISLDDTESVPARVVGYDRASDVAVIAASRADIKETGVRYTVARFGNSDELRMGDSVIAIGNAMGEGQTVTRGIISALSIKIEIPDMRNRLSLDVLQTDAAVNRGNSGGPLVNQNGEVVGIVTAKLIGADIEGMGYALPANNVQGLLTDIMETGSVRRTYIGIHPEDVSEFIRDLFNLPSTGVLVQDVIENSPAEEAGIKRGDLIVQFGTRRISGTTELQASLNSARPGDEVTLGIYRDGERIQISVELSSRMN